LASLDGLPRRRDYAISNGNHVDVVSAAHGLRDGTYEQAVARATDTGGDLRPRHRRRRILRYRGRLLLPEGRRAQAHLPPPRQPSHHRGEAKRNEFIVRGQRLIGPQGSNEGAPERLYGGVADRDVAGRRAADGVRVRKAGPGPKADDRPPHETTNTQLWSDDFESHGFHFDSPTPHWVRNPWATGWRNAVARGGPPRPPAVAGGARRAVEWGRREPQVYLDSMTYEQWLTGVRGFHPEVARYVDPIYASGMGLGSDVLSAYSAYTLDLPGFLGLGVDKGLERGSRIHPGRTPARLVVSRRQRRHPALHRQVAQPRGDRRLVPVPDVHNGRYGSTGWTCPTRRVACARAPWWCAWTRTRRGPAARLRP